MPRPITTQALEELMGIKNVIVSNFGLRCQPFPVAPRPFTYWLCSTLFGPWCSADDSHPERMTTTVAGNPYNQYSWLFTE